MEENLKNKLKPFDIEEAKRGAPVYTRDGRKVRVLCFDAKQGCLPIVTLVTNKNGEENLFSYFKNGKFSDNGNVDTNDDLMIGPLIKEGWINVYYFMNEETDYSTDNIIFNSKKDALEWVNKNDPDYITTIKVSWEE